MPKTGSRSEPNQEISYSRLYDGTTNKRELLVAFHPRLFLFFFRSLVFMFPFLRTCFPLSDSTLHAAIPSLFLSCRFLHSHSPFHFFPLSLSIPTTDIPSYLPNKTPKCSAAANGGIPVELLLFVQRRVCWLRRKMAQVKRRYGEGVEELALRASTDVGYMRL